MRLGMKGRDRESQREKDWESLGVTAPKGAPSKLDREDCLALGDLGLWDAYGNWVGCCIGCLGKDMNEFYVSERYV